MQEISYVRNGQVVVFKNPEGIPLKYGGWSFTDTRWIVTDNVFKSVVETNADVKFIETEGKPTD